MNRSFQAIRCAMVFSLCVLVISLCASGTMAQSSPSAQPEPTPSLERKFFQNILRDQRDIWLAPFHLHRNDVKWVAPLGLSTAILFATDRHTSDELVENGDNLERLRISHDISKVGSLYVTGGIAAAFYVTGRFSHDSRARETGLLAAESLIDSNIVASAVKVVSQRQRPPTDHSSGEFFDRGSSFPSGHAISSWALAEVVAEEYGQHRPLVRFGAYGIATAVSLSRYTGRNHFLSDVLVGSVMGFGIGRYVYHQHHDVSLDLPNNKQTSRLFQSKLFPRITPLYIPRARVCGAGLGWNF